MATETKQLYEFGPFRLDPDKLVLLRDDRPVPLPPKAFETLLVLVQHSVQHSETVVLKDDLMKSVWPDTFVEESNLAQNIFVLRKTLADAAGDRRYIVTVPGRGYRFTEKVRLVPERPDIVVESHSITRVVVDEQSDDKTSSRWWPWVGVTAIALAAVFAVAWYESSHRAPKLTEKDTVVIADFANTTGDPVFDGALRQGLSAQLEQSPFLNLLSDRRATQTLALMGQPKDARLTHELAQEVCQRTAGAAVLDGSIAQVGASYLLTLRALDCSNGEALASAEAEASDKNHVLDSLGSIASAIRGKLGESLASVEKYDVRPEDVTTPSLEALKAYSLAMKERNRPGGDFTVTRQLFQRAIDLDPNFAMAYAQLGVVYVNYGQTERGVENLRKAYQLRERVSEREKFYISSHYDDMVTGDLEAARKDYEVWEQLYPRDGAPVGNLGVVYFYLGDFDKLLAMTAKSEKLNAVGEHQHSANLAWCYILLNRFDEAKAIALDAQATQHDDPAFHFNLYMIDFLQHDVAGMKKEAAGLIGNPTWGHDAFQYQADIAAYGGQFTAAREFTQRAVDAARKSDKPETAATDEAGAAIREALVGNSTGARQQVKATLALFKSKNIEAMAAFASSLAGDSAEATQLSSDLAKRFPHDTLVQLNYLPTIQAASELRKGDAANAIQTLAAATPYEMGITALTGGTTLYPAYMRGEAYLAAKQGPAAAAEFQKILDHPGVVQDEIIGALAHLGQGRAYVLQGESSQARAAYQDFFTLWKEADPDVPILKQARTEYARLQ
jgi:DNA-binding winged helix-turn-helix (wHTH) protein/tetratricopeptide (TPR) repeat protein